jgi:hypothetical protein
VRGCFSVDSPDAPGSVECQNESELTQVIGMEIILAIIASDEERPAARPLQ